MAHTSLTVQEMVAHCVLITLKRLRKPNFFEAGEEAVVFLMKKVSQLKNRFTVELDEIEYDAKFVFEIPGYNLEGSEVGAAFGLAQLESR